MLSPLFGILFIFLLVGCRSAAADRPNTPLPEERSQEKNETGDALKAVNEIDEAYLLSQVTKVPDLIKMPTLTMIPTVTPHELAEEALPTAPSVSLANIVLDFIRPATRVPTAEPTQVPTEEPAATPDPNFVPTPALPDLPPILPTPRFTQTVRVPILMYHYVSSPPEDADKYRVNLSVEPENFRQQMAYLQEHEVEVIDLYTLTEYLVRSEPPPENAVILTFDDGYVDNYEYAFPILEEFGYKGTFFIPTEFIDRQLPQYMSWEMIEEMAAAGHRFESHTKNHPDLAILGYNDLVWQILGSQETLAAHLGYKPQYLSYPSGSYNEETLEMVERLSLWGAVTTKGGLWRGYDDRYEWPRTRISYGTTIKDLEKVIKPKSD